MNRVGFRMIGWTAAVITTAAVVLILNDIIRNVTFWKSAFDNVWTLSDHCLVEQVSDSGRPSLSDLKDAPALKTDRLKFPLRLNPNLNYFISEGRAARVTCQISQLIEAGNQKNSKWLILGPIDGDLALWIDGKHIFNLNNQTAFPVIPLETEKNNFDITILTRAHQNGQLAMTSLFPISVADNWVEVLAIQKVYSFARAILPFSTLMFFLGLSVLFVVAFNLGIHYSDVRWAMIGLSIGLVEQLIKWRLGVSQWWTYEMQLAVYSSLGIALCHHIHRELSRRLEIILFCIPTMISISLAFLDPPTRGIIVTGFKLTSWIQVILYSGVALSGLRKTKGLPKSRARARRIGIYVASIVALGLITTNLLIEIKGIWLREVMMLVTSTLIAGMISIDLVLFHRGYFKEKALRTDEQIRREHEEREKLRLAEVLAIGQTAQELLLPMVIERKINGFRLNYRCLPHINMAGDWMDSWEGPDGKVIVLIGDVSGKGPSAAIAMAAIMTLTQEFRINKSSLEDAIKIMSPRIYGLFKGAIVSTWAGLEISTEGKVSFSGGGSPGWFILSSSQVKMIPCRQSMLGLSDRPIDYTFQSETIERESRIISVSDGICGSSRQLKQFMNHVNSLIEGEQSSESIILSLLEFASLQKIADDRSLIIVEPESNAITKDGNAA